MATAAETDGHKVSGVGTLALGALGVVYGDIGTSPLYTIKTAVDWAGGSIAPEEALGILLSLIHISRGRPEPAVGNRGRSIHLASCL